MAARIDPRTPVIVGAAAVGTPLDVGAADRPEPWELMVDACRAAADDAGAPAILARADQTMVPRGSWPGRDPARLVANAIGASGSRTLVADVGVLQTTLLARAVSAIRSGHADVVVVCGAEARHRHRMLEAAGLPPTYRDDSGDPDEVLRPAGRIISEAEGRAGLVSAAAHYALIENARRSAECLSLDDHLSQVAGLWARFNRVAAANPKAWFRREMSAGDIASESGANRWIAFPYRKWQVSQWNVDQGAALIVCSAAAARDNGVPVDRWVFVHAVSESNHMVPVSERAEVHRSPGFALAGAAVREATGLGVDDLDVLDLYSCFPVAVFVQAAELGVSLERELTVTGGMTWAGGPLNNYVLQSAAAMCDVLRAGSSRTGMLTAISGLITKQGVAILGTGPPDGPVHVDDVTSAAAEVATVPVVSDASGNGSVLTYTVTFSGDQPQRGIVLAEHADGERALASTDDAGTMADMLSTEWCGRPVKLDGAGGFSA